MLPIANPAARLEAFLGSAFTTDVKFTVGFYNMPQQDTAASVRQLPTTIRTVSNGVTDVQIAPYPGQNSISTAITTGTGAVQVITYVKAYNTNASSVKITIQINDGNDDIQFSATLLTLEALYYEDGRGWYCVDANGNNKEVTSSVFSSLTITGLLDISATGAGQIKFPAAQNASADANTLDDYEEGTWTPVLTFGGGSTGLTYTTQLGTYTKIGRQVGIQMNVTVNDNGSSSGNAEYAGLPFTVGTITSALGDFINGHTGITVGVSIAAITATTVLRPFFGGGNGSVTQFTEANITNGANQIAMGIYSV